MVDRIGVLIKMKVALAQTYIKWEDKKYNIAHAENIINQAVENNVDIILFPEMSFTGFTMNTKLSSETDVTTVECFRVLAKNKRVAIGIGWVMKGNIKAENHYTVIDKDGKVIADYTKIHPFSFAKENHYFQAGNEIVKFDLCGFRWSTFICYDLRFPEIFQAASLDSDIIAVPANWPQRREEHWKSLLKARAIENQCYILGINCVGEIGDIQYSGFTCGISPDGDVLGYVTGEEQILYIEINENVQKVRNGFPVKKDRNWKLYREIYEGL
jgi:predicted amidohydrolase